MLSEFRLTGLVCRCVRRRPVKSLSVIIARSWALMMQPLCSEATTIETPGLVIAIACCSSDRTVTPSRVRTSKNLCAELCVSAAIITRNFLVTNRKILLASASVSPVACPQVDVSMLVAPGESATGLSEIIESASAFLRNDSISECSRGYF